MPQFILRTFALRTLWKAVSSVMTLFTLGAAVGAAVIIPTPHHRAATVHLNVSAPTRPVAPANAPSVSVAPQPQAPKPVVQKPVAATNVAAAPPRPAYAPVRYAAAAPGGHIALIIGISNAPGASQLPGSRTDALTMRDALLKYGFPAGNITMLLDAQATRGAILNALSNLAARSSSNGVAVVSITTHGSPGSFRAWDGRVYANELGSRLGAVRGKLWTTLATCYSGSMAVAGVTGNNRIAVFSSSASEKSWQVGSAGSPVIITIVREAMIEGKAPSSVESALDWAYQDTKTEFPGDEFLVQDGIPGKLVLGPVTWLSK